MPSWGDAVEWLMAGFSFVIVWAAVRGLLSLWFPDPDLDVGPEARRRSWER